MRKRIIIHSIICVILIIGIVGFLYWNNRIVSTITLDINPSVEINLDKNDNVISVVALNEDAKNIIDFDYKGKSFDDIVSVIINNSIESGYVEDDRVVVIVHSDGNIGNEDVKELVIKNFVDKGITTDVIVVENITEEDKELAEKYNVSPAKASYIYSITENSEVDISDLKDKSIEELKDTKESGKYCENGYILEGTWCLKEISRESAKSGEVCPRNYREYNGKCYEEVGILENDNLVCGNEFKLEGTKCVRTLSMKAEPKEYSCSSGELKRRSEIGIRDNGSGDDYICADFSKAKKPVLRCLNNKGHIMINGKCYNGPAPTINGGCPNGDTKRNGSCYSLDSYDQYECPNGSIYHVSKGGVPEYCPDTVKTTKATIVSYSCPDGFEVDGTKCIRYEEEDAMHERYCPNGYTLINDMCLNKNNVANKTDGLVCEGENTRLKGKDCVTYEMVEAKNY